MSSAPAIRSCRPRVVRGEPTRVQLLEVEHHVSVSPDLLPDIAASLNRVDERVRRAAAMLDQAAQGRKVDALVSSVPFDAPALETALGDRQHLLGQLAQWAAAEAR